MDYIAEIAKQGFLGIVVALQATIIFYQYKKINELYEKRFGDKDRDTEVFVGVSRDLINAITNLQRTADNNSTIIQEVRDRVWNYKQS